MSRWYRGDQTGVPQTCPTIDEIIRLAESVRSANEELRRIANEAIDQRDKYEEEVDRLQSDLDAAYREIARGDARISELELSLHVGEIC